MTTARPAPLVAFDDAELARAAALGDQSAFGAIYDRYADRLHDFCVGMLRDRDAAADCVQDVFVTAATRLGQLREPDRLRSWLYAIARNEALARIRERRREQPSEQLPETPSGEPDPATIAARGELAELIGEACGGLSDRDRTVLELSYRRGLDGPELAAALGVSHSNANNLVGRLRQNMERSLGALLVCRTAATDPERCPELAALLVHWDGKFTVLMRKRVARHIEGCAVCEEDRARMVNPVALLGSVPVIVPAPAWLREHTLTQVAGILSQPAAPPATPGGHPGAEQPTAGVGSPPGAGAGLSWWPPRDIDTTDLGDAASVTPEHPGNPPNAGAAPNRPLSPQPGAPSEPEPFVPFVPGPFAPAPPAAPPGDPPATGLDQPPQPGPTPGSAQVPHDDLNPPTPVVSLPTDSAPGHIGDHIRTALLVALLLLVVGSGALLGPRLLYHVWPASAPGTPTAPAPSTAAPTATRPTPSTAAPAQTPTTTAPAATTPTSQPPPPATAPSTTAPVSTTAPGRSTTTEQIPPPVPTALPPKTTAPGSQTSKTFAPNVLPANPPTPSAPAAPTTPPTFRYGHRGPSNGGICPPGTTC